MLSVPKGPYEFVTCVHPPSDLQLESVVLCSGKDIPAGIPMDPMLSLLVSICGSWMVFLFSWGQNGHDHLSASSSTVESLMTRRLPLIRPDGYKDWS
jgi:hypothetical protein